MISSHQLTTPGVLYLTSGRTGRHRLEQDGSETLFYQLPNDLIFKEPHSVKVLAIVAGSAGFNSPTEPAMVCLATFSPLQALFGEALPVLGSSFSGANVYHPLTTNYLSASGELRVRRLDGEPFNVRHNSLCVILHVTPTRLIDPCAS